MSTSRRSGLQHLLSLLAAVMLLVGTAGSALAQATPEASGSAGEAGPAIGDTVVLFDASGDEAVHIAVTSLVDPDEDVERGDRGFHWVSIEVVVENVGDSVYQLNTYGIQLVDGEGFVSSVSFASRSSEDSEARPDLSGNEIAAGDTISGWLFFQVINGTEPAWVVLNDSFGTGQFAVLANVQGAEVADGDPVTFFDTSAEEIGTVTVDEIISGFEGVDPSVEPNRGMTAIGLVVTLENTGTADLEPNSYAFYLIDDFGYLYYPTFYFRDSANGTEYPDLPTDVLASGDSASGLITFEIPNDAEVNYIIYQPDYTQLYIVAQPGEGSVTSGDTLEPVEVPTAADNGDNGDDDNGDDNGSTGVETGECVGVADWIDTTADNVAVLDNLASTDVEDLADADVDDLRDDADLLRDAADAQENLDVPDVAQDMNDLMVDFLTTYADLFDEAADRLEDGDDPADIQADMEDNTELTTLFSEMFETSGVLAEACPDSNVDEIFG